MDLNLTMCALCTYTAAERMHRSALVSADWFPPSQIALQKIY
ncbi:MAG: hypothetical protein AAB150_03125 [Pseudomonadota bacterium]